MEDVERVVGELTAFTDLFEPTFGRSEPAALFELYMQGLLSDAERKNVEAIALKLDGPQRVRNLQRFMSNSPWDEAWMRTRHWELCAQALSDPQGVWSIDASEFPKKGDAPVGVAPQYCGALGQTCANWCASAARAGPLNDASRKTNPNWASITLNRGPGPPGIDTCAWCFWRNYSPKTS